jgi:hypothetical protein
MFKQVGRILQQRQKEGQGLGARDMNITLLLLVTAIFFFLSQTILFDSS